MLQMMVSKRIGRRQFHFTVQGPNFHEVVAEYDRLSFPDLDKCGVCGSVNLDLNSRLAQDKFKYTSVKCVDCRASLDFGKRQDDDQTYFYRKNLQRADGLDWKSFEAKQS